MTPIKSLRPVYALMLLFTLTVALYYGSLVGIFFKPNAVSIDDMQLMNDLLNHDLQLTEIFTPGVYGKYYRPFLTLSYLMDQQFYGSSPFGFRLTNVLFHAFNVLFLYLITKIVCKHSKQVEIISFFSALLFAVHPAAVEAISWISGRTDILATFWSLSALSLYFSARITGKWYLLPGSLLSAFASVLSKETGLVTPLVMAAWELFYFEGPANGKKRTSILFAVLCVMLIIAYFLLRSMTLSSGDMSMRMIVSGLSGESIVHTVEALFAAVGFYLKKFIYPFPLTVAINQINVFLYASAGLLAVAMILFIASRNTVHSFLFLWALLGIAPAAMISLTSIAWTPWAERYLYYSIPPLSILAALFVFNPGYTINDRTRRGLFITGTCIMIVFAISSIYRSFLWNDNLRIWRDTYVKSPGFMYAATGYADALAEKGRSEESEKILLGASGLSGPKHVLYLRLGQLNHKKGNRNKAEEYYLKALHDARNDANLVLVGSVLRKNILLSLASIELATGDQSGKNKIHYHKAITNMLEAYNEEPSNSFLLYQIAKQYLFLGENNNAKSYLTRFIAKGGEDSHIRAAKKMLERIESKKRQPEKITISESNG